VKKPVMKKFDQIITVVMNFIDKWIFGIRRDNK